MASEAGILLLKVLSVFIIAAAVGTFVVRMWELSYTVALLLAGLAVSVLVSLLSY